MSVQELERFTTTVKRDAKLRDQLRALGHDTGAFVKIANGLGYNFTENDVNAYVIKKQAQISREKATQLAAQVEGVAVTTTVGVQTTAAVTTIGGGVVAVEVAVLT